MLEGNLDEDDSGLGTRAAMTWPAPRSAPISLSMYFDETDLSQTAAFGLIMKLS